MHKFFCINAQLFRPKQARSAEAYWEAIREREKKKKAKREGNFQKFHFHMDVQTDQRSYASVRVVSHCRTIRYVTFMA